MEDLTEHRLYLREYCYVDFKQLIFMKKDLPCALTHTEILLLERIAANMGHIVTYKELLSIFYDKIDANELHVYMSRLICQGNRLHPHIDPSRKTSYKVLTKEGDFVEQINQLKVIRQRFCAIL